MAQYRILDPKDTSEWTVEDHLDWIRTHAAQICMMNEIKLNVMLTTWQARMGVGPGQGHTLDLVDTRNKYRAMGAIR